MKKKDDLVKLEIDVYSYFTEKVLGEHLDVNLKRNLPFATEGMIKYPVASICGAGPSFKNTIKELQGDIWACNGAYNFLQDNGIVPDYFFGWDAAPEFMNFLSRPHKNTTFFIASICQPEVFEHLKDYKVVMWHPYFDDIVKDKLAEHRRMEMMTGGGSACLTRAPVLLRNLGYKEIHLHGADSSMENDLCHIGENGITGEDIREITCAGRKFTTPLWLAAQAQEFPGLASNLGDTKIIVHGDGLLPHIARVLGLHYDSKVAEAA